MLKHFKLKNGINVATYDLPNVRSFHLRVTAKGGSILETPQTSGLAHFMEHLLVQGIPSFPGAEILSEYIEGLSGTYNAGTTQHSINFTITLPTTHIEDALKISSEVFFKPLFPEDVLEKERKAIIEEVKQATDSTGYKLATFLREIRFKKDCALVRSVGGSPKTLSKFKKQDLVDYWQKHFVPKNTYVLAIGKFEEKALTKLLENHYGIYESKKEFIGLPKFSKKDFSPRKTAIRFDTKLRSNYIDLTFPSISAETPLKTRLMQNLLLVILSNLRRSRLFRLLRYRLGLVYGVNAGSYTTDGLGYVYISSETSKQSLEQVITLIAQQLSDYAKNGPTEEELNHAKEFLSNHWLMSFDHPSSIAGWIENDLLWEEKIRLPEEVISLIKDVKVENLVELMQTHWDFSKLQLTIQGGLKNTKENAEKFSKPLEPLV